VWVQQVASNYAVSLISFEQGAQANLLFLRAIIFQKANSSRRSEEMVRILVDSI
jgi:hypothetical protein